MRKYTNRPLDANRTQDSKAKGENSRSRMTRWGFATSLAVALVAGPSLVDVGQVQAAGLSDLFGGSSAQQSPNKFLKVEDAFSVEAVQKGNQVTVSMDITPKHYLYKDKLSLKLPEGVSAAPFDFSQPSKMIDDPVFGKVAVFKQPQVMATTTLVNNTGAPIKQNITLTWQGCADAGLCYPPQQETVAINLAAAPASKTTQSAATNTKADADVKTSAESFKASANTDKTSSTQTSQATASQTASNQKNNSNSAQNASQNASQNKPSSESSGSNDAGNSNLSAQSAGGALAAAQVGSDNDDVDTESDASESGMQTEGTGAEVVDATELNNEQPNNQAGLQATNINTASNEQQGSRFDVDGVVDQDPFGLAEHPWLALLLLFLAGLGLAFTPCVLPMLPIVSNIVARQHKPTAKKGLMLSGSYALGVAIAYGVLGAVIAVFGQSLGIIGWLQNPVILLVFAAVFVLLALYMLDVVKITLPNAIRQKTHLLSQVGDKYLGSSFGSFIAGFLSALVVSPCVSAPLFGALLAVSTIGSPLLGFAALFMLGFGLSAPLMLLGVSQGNLMPKAGEWMNWVKQGFALLLFAVALLLVERVLISPIMLMLWAVWFMVVAAWAWSWLGRGQMLTKPLAIVLAAWSAMTLLGAAAGSKDAWQPLRVFSQPVQMMPNSAVTLAANNGQGLTSSGAQALDIHITSLNELVPLVQNNPKVLVDVTAEWCVECRIMDKTLFTNRPAAMQDWQLVRLDITESNADSARVLSELQLFGPPALLYFVDGTLKVQQVGTINRAEFEQTLAGF